MANIQINRTREKVLRVRVSDAEYDRCAELAESLGFRSISDWLRDLIERENKRRADLRAAQRKAGRKRTDTPAASTLRARASRARKRAGKEGGSEPES